MERTLYLWCSSEERVAVDLHLVILADRDGADIVLVARLRERIVVDLHLVILADKGGF